MTAQSPSHGAQAGISAGIFSSRGFTRDTGAGSAEHKRHFTRNISYFEPWHYVPLLDRKPGALRNGAHFVGWQLPAAIHQIKDHYMQMKGGDREFVDLLLQVQEHGIEVVEVACELAIEQKTLRLSAIINLGSINARCKIGRSIRPIDHPSAHTSIL